MKTNTTAPHYKGFRLPPEISSHTGWWSFRFSLSFREVEALLAQRGMVITSETIRPWCVQCGQTSANELRRRRPRCGDTWHLDEVSLQINGKTHSLWRAVDQDGNVLDILVQSRRNTPAAQRFFRQLLKGLPDVPRVISTAKLKSDGAAKREILPGVEHRQHTRLNHRAENAHHPTRLRERKMRRVTSAKHAQRFLSAFGPIAGHCQPRRPRLRAREYRAILQGRFQQGNEVTGVKQVVYPPRLPHFSLSSRAFLLLAHQYLSCL